MIVDTIVLCLIMEVPITVVEAVRIQVIRIITYASS